MSFGLTTNGFNGSLSFSTEWPSLQYYGKATRVTGTGLTYFAADSGSLHKFSNVRFGYDNIVQSEPGTGARRLSTGGWCGAGSVTLTIPDTSGVFTYSIACPTYPQIFINSTDVNVSGVVISIADSGTTSGDMPVWYIKILVGYPAGFRASALVYLSLYCFAKIKNQTPTGHGINTFLADGTLSYSSNIKTLLVKDVITINSTTLVNPADLASLLVNDTTSATPVVAWNDMTKPSFLNIDWGHYLWRTSFNLGTIAYGYDETYGECEAYGPAYAYFEQGFIIGGVRLNSAKTARIYGLQGLDVVTWLNTLRTNAGNLITKKESVFPIYIPIIDGADYD